MLQITSIVELQAFCCCELFYPQKYCKKPFDFLQYKEFNMEQLSSEKKAELLDKFIKFYAEDVPFGYQAKTNIDAFIYGLLEEFGYFKGCKTTQDIAIKLRINTSMISGGKDITADVIKALQ